MVGTVKISVSRERFQQILDQASAHFRNQIAQGAAARRILEVRGNRIVQLPTTSNQEFNRYAEYISSACARRILCNSQHVGFTSLFRSIYA